MCNLIVCIEGWIYFGYIIQIMRQIRLNESIIPHARIKWVSLVFIFYFSLFCAHIFSARTDWNWIGTASSRYANTGTHNAHERMTCAHVFAQISWLVVIYSIFDERMLIEWQFFPNHTKSLNIAAWSLNFIGGSKPWQKQICTCQRDVNLKKLPDSLIEMPISGGLETLTIIDSMLTFSHTFWWAKKKKNVPVDFAFQ